MKTRGRPTTKKPKILEARPLTRDDLVHLQPGKPRAQCGVVQRFRETHHRLARLVAFGYRYEQIADMTGYSLQRLYTLGPTPAFKELVAQYQGRVTEEHIRQYDDFKTTGFGNLLRLEKQVEAHIDTAEETGELIPLKTLTQLIADRADRFGYGKHTTQTNVNIDLAGKLERARIRSGKSNVIDAKATHVTSPATGGALLQSPAEAGLPSPVSPQVPQSPRVELGAQLKSFAMLAGVRRT